jgi:hypothetical protein
VTWWRFLALKAAEGADLPAMRARYSLTLKDDSAGPGTDPAAVPGAPQPNAAAAAAADGGASRAGRMSRGRCSRRQ